MPIKLAHITTVPQSLCGFFNGQMRYMSMKGIEVHAISSPGPKLNQFGSREGVQVHAIPMCRAITPLKDVLTIIRMSRLLRQIRPHIVHAHTPKAGLCGIISARLASVPICIYHIHGFPFMTANGFKRKLLKTTEKISCHLSDRILCVSKSLKEYAVEQSVCKSERISTLNNGTINGIDAKNKFDRESISRETIDLFRLKYGLYEDKIVLGYVGRIARDKGLVDLYDAWLVLREVRTDIHLMIVGSVDERDPVPVSVMHALRRDDRVHFTGSLEEVAIAYAVMNVLVLPTHREGFGLVAAEAAAMKLPVVATDVPGCRDAIVDGVTGTLIRAQAPDQIIAAVRRYIGDRDLCAQHGAAGRERILRDFKPETIWEETYGEYMDLLRSKRCTGAIAEVC